MDGTFLKADKDGLVHYYCDHHAPEGATCIGKAPKQQSNFKKFLPLIVIFSSIFFFTLIPSVLHNSLDIAFSMRMMMGSFFAIFGLFKIFNLRAFTDAYSTYDILAKRSRAYAFIYPFLELSIAAFYLADIGGIYRDVFTFALMTVSTIGVIQKIREKEEIPCACLGMVFKIPMTSVTLIEDVVMALEALIMVLMTLGQPIAYADTTTILAETLKIHTTAEWVKYSVLGHRIIGVFLLIVIAGGIIEHFKLPIRRFVSKYLVPILFLILGLSLSFVDVIYHSIYDNPYAVGYLLTHWSQFLQHFMGGILFTTAGVAEWIRQRKNIPWLAFVTSIVIFLTGSIFFFHQQLGITQSVIASMNWHLLFGACLIIGGAIKVIDLLLGEEKKGFLAVWVIVLLIGAVMMATYQEPVGAYQLSTIIF
ncbi:MAG: hypothetical protein K1X61_13280 [Chitinophagales bacterium]|nr:hypothetical protein [Chitinophagales bacterium]